MGKKILVIDDNEAAADSLARLLSALGFEARALYSGEAALAHAESYAPDIFFIDIGMPEMTGYELAYELRTEKQVTVPLIALSGYGQEHHIREAYDSGFSIHITKPIGVDQIREVLSVLDNK